MKKILFVEDEQRGVSPYFKSLEKYGFDCTLASDGDQALKLLQNEKYDLISLDVMFEPGKSFAGKTEPQKAGLYLLQLIRSDKIPNCAPSIKVMVLTAIVNPQVEEKIKHLGVAAYMKKPVEFDKVVNTIKKLVI